MKPDLMVGIGTLLLGAGLAIWAVVKRAGGVTIFVGLALAFMGFVNVTTNVVSDGPAKNGMLAVYAVIAVIMLVVAVRKNRQSAQNPRP